MKPAENEAENIQRERDRSCEDQAGEILQADSSIVIATGDGALSLSEVQLEEASNERYGVPTRTLNACADRLNVSGI
jgi:methionyl-tRNA formyltransferase